MEDHNLRTIIQEAGISVKASEATTLEAFMRYGRKETTPNSCFIADGKIIGLNLRANELSNFSLADPAFHTLQALQLTENKLTTLTLPAHLQQLRYIDISDMPSLQTLTIEGGLPALETLDAGDSGLTTLHLPAGFAALKKLDVSRNKLTTCTFEEAYAALEMLDISGNQLKKLTLPAGWTALKYLYLKDNKLETLSIEGQMEQLEVLHLMGNQIEELPSDIILDSPLTALYAANNSPKNIPKLFVGTSSYSANSCLNSGRAWFQELRDFPSEKNKVVKLMLTGNGNVGKTTLMCALENGGRCTCDEQHSSTHGVQIDNWENDDVIYNYWDFGGQEVYHGTHRLFMESDALQVIVFDPKSEQAARDNEKIKDRIREDMIYNHPLEYWYESNKALSPASQFFIVQNKKEILPEEDEVAAAYARKKATFLHADAKTGEDVDLLVANFKNKAKKIPAYDMEMPLSWLQIRQFFIDNLAKKKPQRVISKGDFIALCKKHQFKVANEQLLKLLMKYLHHGGFMYTNDRLGDTIIADQRWALDAIYKPLDRAEDHYKEFKEDLKGRIRVRQLFKVFGTEYSVKEKWLFLSFMESCRLCFEMNIRAENKEKSTEDVYIFPEFLPEEEPSNVQRNWADRTEVISLFRFKMPWIDYSRIQAFICALGRKTPPEKIWKTGIHIETPEGWFKVNMDYKERAIILSIEEKAMTRWLSTILEELEDQRHTKSSWERSTDRGATYTAFDLEAWKQQEKKASSVVGEEIVGAKGQGKFSELKEVDQKTGLRDVEKREKLPRPATPIIEVPMAARARSFVKFSKGKKQKIKILFLAASPMSEGQLNTGSESRFKVLIKYFDEEKRFRFKEDHGLSSEEFRNSLISQKPHILHYGGHGAVEGILLEDKPLTGTVLASLLKLTKNTQCVILNACNSMAMAKEIAQHIPYVVATCDKIKDDVAIVFARGFYMGIVTGMSVEDAFDLGLVYVRAENLSGEDVLILVKGIKKEST